MLISYSGWLFSPLFGCGFDSGLGKHEKNGSGFDILTKRSCSHFVSTLKAGYSLQYPNIGALDFELQIQVVSYQDQIICHYDNLPIQYTRTCSRRTI